MAGIFGQIRNSGKMVFFDQLLPKLQPRHFTGKGVVSLALQFWPKQTKQLLKVVLDDVIEVGLPHRRDVIAWSRVRHS